MQKIIRLTGLIVIDALLINISYILAFLLRYDFVTDTTLFSTTFEVFLTYWYFLTIIKILVFWGMGLYSSLWKFAGGRELQRLLAAVFASNILTSLFVFIFNGEVQRSLIVLPLVFDLLLIGGIRLIYRFSSAAFMMSKGENNGARKKKVMIVGGGYSSVAIIKEMRLYHNEIGAVPVVVIYDKKDKIGNRISGVKIGGIRRDIPRLARKHKIDEIYITLPSSNKKEMQAVMEECDKTNCKVRRLPSMHELIGGKMSISNLISVDSEDLLGKESVETDVREINAAVKGRIVLVTGAGDTVGGEICRQICAFSPRKIIAMDVYETGILELQFELNKLYPDVEVQVVVCPMSDNDAIKSVFENNKPHIVFHTSIYKNVQYMEENPKEAVKHNVFGTVSLLNASEAYAVEKFVFVSSEKATKPVGIAGMAARTAEIIVQRKSSTSKTQYTTVRISGILGSDGTVVSLFKKQIEEGGPVTVTHPDTVRHFMNLEPAVQLILETLVLAQGGEIFILNLGKAVRIMELAENIIKLCGYKPHDEIPITLVGLRPGERVFEEFFPEEDIIGQTSHSRIFTLETEKIPDEIVDKRLSVLWEELQEDDNVQLRNILRAFIA